jgi:hypothetical protein
MPLFSLLALAAFDVVVSIVQVPKMLRGRLYRELSLYAFLLALGTALAVMKIFDIDIPNPTDFFMWVFSPLSGLMKKLT